MAILADELRVNAMGVAPPTLTVQPAFARAEYAGWHDLLLKIYPRAFKEWCPLLVLFLDLAG